MFYKKVDKRENVQNMKPVQIAQVSYFVQFPAIVTANWNYHMHDTNTNTNVILSQLHRTCKT